MIDLYKEFHSQTVEREYPPSARLLGYWFIGAFNDALWEVEVRYSERELSRLTGLPPASIHRAIKYLCDRGFMRTRKQENKTAFRLLSEKVPAPLGWSNCGALAEQNPLLGIPSSKVIKKDVKTNAHARRLNGKKGESDCEDAKAYCYVRPRQKKIDWVNEE